MPNRLIWPSLPGNVGRLVPLGSGSIAQVHQGVLQRTGQAVAVKVCHPGVKEDITRDFECIQWLARRVDPLAKWMCLPEQAYHFGLKLRFT